MIFRLEPMYVGDQVLRSTVTNQVWAQEILKRPIKILFSIEIFFNPKKLFFDDWVMPQSPSGGCETSYLELKELGTGPK